MLQTMISIVIILLSAFLGWLFLYFSYYFARINIAQRSQSVYPKSSLSSIQSLIDEFDTKIRIRIVDAPITETSAVTLSFLPSYIVLSERLFEKRANAAEQFVTDDLNAIVAHELGHIVTRNYFMLIMWIMISSFLTASAFVFYSHPFFFCSSVLFLFLLSWFPYLSRNEEYQADRFAVTRVKIHIEQFVQSLKKLDIVFAMEIPIQQRQSIFRKIFRPTIEQRIAQLYNINSTRK